MTWPQTLAANLATAAALLRSFELGDLFSRAWQDLRTWCPMCGRDAPDVEQERERICREERRERRVLDTKLVEAVERMKLS